MLILLDILANAGGVVVSYFEWVQGLQEYFWREDEVNAKLHDIVARAFEAWQTKDRRTRAAHGVVRSRGAAGCRGDHDEGPLPVRRVVVYTADRCTLCERALEVVREFGEDVAFDLDVVSIDGDPGLGRSPRASSGARDRRRAGVHVLRPTERVA